jgi:hypothetical protein
MENFKTITVGELMQLLSDYDPETQVIFATNYGDRARTQQAHAIRGEAEEVTLHESGYSDSGFAIDEDDSDSSDETFLRIR